MTLVVLKSIISILLINPWYNDINCEIEDEIENFIDVGERFWYRNIVLVTEKR